MATANIQVIDPERVSGADAMNIPAGRIARTLPPGPMEEKEAEGQYTLPYHYRCPCGTVFRVQLDTDYLKYFYCACGRYLFRA